MHHLGHRLPVAFLVIAQGDLTSATNSNSALAYPKDNKLASYSTFTKFSFKPHDFSPNPMLWIFNSMAVSYYRPRNLSTPPPHPYKTPSFRHCQPFIEKPRTRPEKIPRSFVITSHRWNFLFLCFFSHISIIPLTASIYSSFTLRPHLHRLLPNRLFLFLLISFFNLFLLLFYSYTILFSL